MMYSDAACYILIALVAVECRLFCSLFYFIDALHRHASLFVLSLSDVSSATVSSLTAGAYGVFTVDGVQSDESRPSKERSAILHAGL